MSEMQNYLTDSNKRMAVTIVVILWKAKEFPEIGVDHPEFVELFNKLLQKIASDSSVNNSEESHLATLLGVILKLISKSVPFDFQDIPPMFFGEKAYPLNVEMAANPSNGMVRFWINGNQQLVDSFNVGK
ncbi:MAG: hypothetical protein OXQ96_04235 [Alphaproteobacteria bacterium]|nr:hypothetical protein [Alphaproteobacteria bacterium]